MVESLREAVRALLAFAETRARIAAGDLEEQALRFAEIALWIAVAAFLYGVALVFVALAVLLALWQTYPLAAALALALVFLGGGTGAAVYAWIRLRERPPFFAETLATLRRDRERAEKQS